MLRSRFVCSTTNAISRRRLWVVRDYTNSGTIVRLARSGVLSLDCVVLDFRSRFEPRIDADTVYEWSASTMNGTRVCSAVETAFISVGYQQFDVSATLRGDQSRVAGVATLNGGGLDGIGCDGHACRLVRDRWHDTHDGDACGNAITGDDA